MELELKHLDFANNSKVRLTRLPHWDFDNVSLQQCGLGFNSVSNKPYLIHRNVTFGLDQIKLYKRPLSDLTKEIEVNGEKFVPIEEYEGRYLGDRIDECVNASPSDLKYAQFHVIEQLLEWHFDIYGLIEAGLAVDINTINQ